MGVLDGAILQIAGQSGIADFAFRRQTMVSGKEMTALTPIPVPQKIGLRAADFLMLSEAGAFDGFARTELIEGEIWAVNAIHSWHARTLMEVGRRLANVFEDHDVALRVFASGSVLMNDTSVPEPDVAIAEDHNTGYLPIEKLKLAIEISDSSAAIDLGVKVRLYATAGVPEYWVVERDAGAIHQMWLPSGDRYAERRTIVFGTPITAATLADLTIATDRLA